MKCDKYIGMDVHQAMTVVTVLDHERVTANPSLAGAGQRRKTRRQRAKESRRCRCLRRTFNACPHWKARFSRTLPFHLWSETKSDHYWICEPCR